MTHKTRKISRRISVMAAALVIMAGLPAAAIAERDHEGHGDHGDRDHGGGEDHGGGDHGGGEDHGGGGDHGGGDHGGSDDHGGGEDHGGSGDHGGGEDHGGGGHDGSDDHGGADDHGGSDDHSGSNDHGGSDDHGGSSDHGGSDDHSGSDDHGGSDSRGGDDAGGDHGSDGANSEDHGGGAVADDGGAGASAGSDVAAAGEKAGGGGLEISYDPDGREYRTGELVVVGDARTAAAAERIGLTVVRQEDLSTLGGSVLTLAVPSTGSAEALLAELKAASPESAADLNSVYRPAGGVGQPPMRMKAGSRRARGVVGLIDTAVDRGQPLLGKAIIDSRSFATGGAESPLHGTVVAYLTAQAGADIVAADVFALDRSGQPAASAEAIARALDWMIANHVTVINLSLAGPPNVALAEVIRRAQARGGVIVAAAGNAGPAAPPAYPAAYPDVVAVTAVDSAGRVYRYANQGAYIMFAARGVDLTPMPGQRLSGTSYASPMVAAMIARRHIAPGARASAQAVNLLRGEARDLGAPGRDPVYGYGLVGGVSSGGR